MNDYINKLLHFFQVQLWQETAESTGKLKRMAHQGVRVLYVMIKQLSTGELNLRAMSLVYTTADRGGVFSIKSVWCSQSDRASAVGINGAVRRARRGNDSQHY